MKIYLDECISANKLKRLLRKHGHDVLVGNEGSLRGLLDGPVLGTAIKEKRILITTDKTFETLYHSKQYGIIKIHGKHTVTKDFAERLVWTIEYISQRPELLDGITLILEQPNPHTPWRVFPQKRGEVITEQINFITEQLTSASAETTVVESRPEIL